MKKLSIIICLILVAILGLSSCSCAEDSSLSFNYNFLGDSYNSLAISYKEEITYTVHKDETGDFFKADSSLPEEFTANLTDGTYKTTFSVLNLDGIKSEPAYNDYTKSLIEKYSNSFFYKLETKLNITSSYSFNEIEKGGEDEITSVVYFSTHTNSYAPIYSEKSANYFLLGVGTNTIGGSMASYEYKTFYGEKKYKVEKTYNPNKENEEKSTEEFNYKATTLIDNTQLLFAFRNITIEKDASTGIPTVEPSYGEKETIVLKNNASLTSKYNITYNGLEKEFSVIENNYSYAISTTNASGRAQTLFIQANSSITDIPYRAFITKYAQPLYEYNGAKIIGGLVYEITAINITVTA